MKSIIFSLLIVACAAIPIELIYQLDDCNLLNQWELFKNKFNKTYTGNFNATLSNEEYRKQVFKMNLQKINEHNILYNNGQSSFTMGINQFTDLVSIFCYLFHQKIVNYAVKSY